LGKWGLKTGDRQGQKADHKTKRREEGGGENLTRKWNSEGKGLSQWNKKKKETYEAKKKENVSNGTGDREHQKAGIPNAEETRESEG